MKKELLLGTSGAKLDKALEGDDVIFSKIVEYLLAKLTFGELMRILAYVKED